MGKISTPTDTEIMGHDNVPVAVAAKYIGVSNSTLYYALQRGRAPFGSATEQEEEGKWTYNISPGGLVKYKREGLPMMGLHEIQADIAEGVE